MIVNFTGSYANGFEVSSTQEFVLRAQIAGAAAGGDSVSVRLNEVSSDASKDTFANTVAKPASVVWSDGADQPTTTSSTDWFTDAFVEVLPTNAWSASASN